MSEYEQSDPTKPKEPYHERERLRDDLDEKLLGWAEQRQAADLVPFFLQAEDDAGKKWLSKIIAKQVCDDFNRGWSSSDEYREKRKRNYQMFTGFLPKKTFPFTDCANAHVPLMMERLLRLSANVFAEIFADRETIFAVKPTGPDDYETAETLTLHGNYQLRNELTDFVNQQEAGIQEFFNAGSVFSHSWYDPIQRRNRHDIMNCEEFVIPYVHTTVQVDLSDVPWKARIIRKYRNELQTLRDTGEWSQVDEVLSKSPPSWDVLDLKNREQSAKHEGIVSPEGDPTAPYVFYEYHGFARMPGETRDSPICAIVESQQKTVMKLYLREEEDWRDRERYDAQMKEFERYQADLAQHQQEMDHHNQVQMQQQELQSRLMDPSVDPVERDMLMQGMQSEQVEPPPEPIAPEWFNGEPPEPPRLVPVENFAHGRCIYNPNGALGLSFGAVLAELNRLADESLNRLYDSATLANIWSIIVPEQLDFGSTTVALQPGKIFRVKGTTAETLKNQIVELRAGQGNPQLMDIVRFASDNADSAVAAPGVLSGEPGKSGETFRGIATRVEKATKQLSAAGTRYLQFLDRILVNNARLNSLFLPENEIIQVADRFMDVRKTTIGPDGKPSNEIRISRDMYRRSYNVTFTADVRFTSQAQRISEADEIVGMIGQIPPLQNNPAFTYAAVTESLRARGKQNLIPLLGPPPPAPTTPFGSPPPPPPGMPVPGGPPPGAVGPGGGPTGPAPGAGPPPPGVPLPAAAPGGIQGPRPGPVQ